MNSIYNRPEEKMHKSIQRGLLGWKCFAGAVAISFLGLFVIGITIIMVSGFFPIRGLYLAIAAYSRDKSLRKEFFKSVAISLSYLTLCTWVSYVAFASV